MKNSSVLSRRAQFAFGFALLAFLIVGTVSQRAIFLSGKSDRWVRHSYEVIGNLDRLAAATQSIEAGYRGFVLTGGESHLQSYRAGIENAVQSERTIRDLTVDNPLQQSRLPALEQLIADTIQFDDAVVELRREKGLEAAANGARTEVGQHLVDKIQDLLREMQNEELRLKLSIEETGIRPFFFATVIEILRTSAGQRRICVKSTGRFRCRVSERVVPSPVFPL